MPNQQTTDMEQWRSIAAAIEDLESANRSLLNELTTDGNVPKGIYGDQYHEINESVTKLKSDLENRLFEEHPDDASIDIFYGDDGSA